MAEESKELTEEEKRVAEARARIEALVAEGVETSSDVSRLIELMRAYQVVGDEESRLRIMRRLKDIPSAADLRAMAGAVVAAVKAAEPEGAVDVDRLRTANAALFEVVESRREVRPGVIMEATGCGCSFAIEVLKAFQRLKIVSDDKDLGLRSVAAEKVVGTVALREDPPPMVLPRDAADCEKALALLKQAGSVSVSQLQSYLGVSYNRAAKLLADLEAQRGILSGNSCGGGKWYNPLT